MRPQTVVVGDVHGCINELERLITRIDLPQAKWIFVGDLINKGPDSVAVLEKAQQLNAEVILGNHELGFLDYVSGTRKSASKEFDDVRRQMGKTQDSWVQWLKSLPLFLESPEFLVVHAGLVPGLHPSQTSARLLTKIRTWDGTGKDLNNDSDPAWFDLYSGQKLVVFGHWAMRGLLVRQNCIGLDTGCVYGGKLSAVVLPERRIVQVEAKKTYCAVNYGG